MTKPIRLERGMRVRYKNRDRRSYGQDVWNGMYGKVLSVDHGTTPWQFIRIEIDNPYSDTFKPITWTERENLRKLPDRGE